jgi:hypothetical protein
VAKDGQSDEDSPAALLDDWFAGLRAEGAKPVKPVGVYQGFVYAYRAHRDGKTI